MKKALIALLLAATPALAQQQPPNAADRIATQLGQLFIQNQQQLDQIAQLTDQLAKAQARIKELEAAAKKPEVSDTAKP